MPFSSAGGEIMFDSTKIDQIVQDILADMPLKEKAAIANLDEDKVPTFNRRRIG